MFCEEHGTTSNCGECANEARDAEIAALRQHAEALAEALKIVAEGGTYETEYDGRSYTRCVHCHKSEEEGQSHAGDCLMLRAQAALAAYRQTQESA